MIYSVGISVFSFLFCHENGFQTNKFLQSSIVESPKTPQLPIMRFYPYLYVFQCKLYKFTWCRSRNIPNFADEETEMPQTVATEMPNEKHWK